MTDSKRRPITFTVRLFALVTVTIILPLLAPVLFVIGLCTTFQRVVKTKGVAGHFNDWINLYKTYLGMLNPKYKTFELDCDSKDFAVVHLYSAN